jgi:hypothetical protein
MGALAQLDWRCMTPFELVRRGLSDELEKIGDIATPLLPHQQRVVDRIQRPDQPGLVVAHGLGSGKTLASIAAQDALKMRADVVVPASLRANYAKERMKHIQGRAQPANIESITNVANKGHTGSAPLLVVDEAHRARDTGSQSYEGLSHNDAEKRLLLTGSPFYNHPSDIAGLINLAAGSSVMPAGREEFDKRYIIQRQIAPSFLNRLRGVKPGAVDELNKKRTNELQSTFKKWVDYHPGSTEGFPEVDRENVEVPMTQGQMHVYDTMMAHAPPWVAAKVRAGLPPSKRESAQLNHFLSAVRQISNTTAGFQQEHGPHDPKVNAAFLRLQKTLADDPAAKAVVYSNFLESGMNPYKQRLDQAKIPYGEFTGQMPHHLRNQMVQDYNSGKLRALLLSSAGGEGLDLKGTRLLQELEPHWNDEKLRQVEGRGARFGSHADLPEDQRKLHIERYLATRPRSGILEHLGLKKPGKAVDQYLTQLSSDKEKLIGQFRGLLPQEQVGG